MSGLLAAAREAKDKGTFAYVDTSLLSYAELAEYMQSPDAGQNGHA
jgi:hypothetical protein